MGEVASDADRLARFDREARTLASLNHPNIAAIYGVERREGTLAIASRGLFEIRRAVVAMSAEALVSS